MNKTLFIFILIIKFFFQISVFAHTDHYKNIKSLEMEIFWLNGWIKFSILTWFFTNKLDFISGAQTGSNHEPTD